MTAAHRFVFLTLLLLACFVYSARAQTLPSSAAPAAATTIPYRPPLLAYGSADQYWIAAVEPYKENGKPRYRTPVRTQTLPAGDWRELGVIFGHAVALAESQGELAVLMDDGSWRRIGDVGLAGNVNLSTGPALPGAGNVLAWGSAASTLYAIRAVEGGKDAVTTRPTEPPAPPAPPATRPSTTPAPSTATISTRPAAAAASRPTTRPLAAALLRYERGQWIGVADLPPGAGNLPVSLGADGNRLLLAVLDGPAIRTYAWVDNQWQDLGSVTAAGRGVAFRLLTAAHLPVLWTITPQGQSALYVKREGQSWAPISAFKLPDNIPPSAQRTLAGAGEDLRLLILSDGKLLEQRYDITGAPRGTPQEIKPPTPAGQDPVIRMLLSFVLMAMVMVMVVTFYKRRAATSATADDDDT